LGGKGKENILKNSIQVEVFELCKFIYTASVMLTRPYTAISAKVELNIV